jgi:alpha-tubulin suppressor-like RCC1 family protein
MKALFKFSFILLLFHASVANAVLIVTNIAEGCMADHSLFIKSDGSLWGMGNNNEGELGDGTSGVLNWAYRSIYSPQEILTNGVTAVAAGGMHSLILKSDGSLWATGYNESGQLGDSTITGTNRPDEIISSGVTAIAAGEDHSLFLKSDGSLWAMGFNADGQLGDGTYDDTNQPQEIVVSGVTAIAAGSVHSLFLKSDGSLWAMGCNEYGQLGDGTFNSTNQPEEIVTSNVIAIAAGGNYDGSGHSLFIKSDGSLWAMGSNYEGQLGDGTTNSGNYVTNLPEEIVTSNVVAIAAGAWFSLFLKSDGSLWAMGNNADRQLGDGAFTSSLQPVEIVDSNVVAIAAGADHSLFLKSDGSLWGMGDDGAGELGDGFSLVQAPYPGRPERIVPLPEPMLEQTIFSNSNLQFTATCPFGGNFYLLAGANLSQPFSQWTPVATNVINNRMLDIFSATLTNVVNSGGQQFYILQSR